MGIGHLASSVTELLFIIAKPHPLFTFLICNVNEVIDMKIKLQWNPCTEVKTACQWKCGQLLSSVLSLSTSFLHFFLTWGKGHHGICSLLSDLQNISLTVSYLYRVNSSHLHFSSRSPLSSPSETLCPKSFILFPCPLCVTTVKAINAHFFNQKETQWNHILKFQS